MKQKFCNILLCASLWCVYHVTEAVEKPGRIPTVVSSIMVVGVQTCALLQSLCYLKVAQINVQCSLI